jgi:serine/threonine-protein phosphatase 2B catalytic subunit
MSRNSRIYRLLAGSLMGRWYSVRKASKKPSRASKTRAYLSFPLLHLQITYILDRRRSDIENERLPPAGEKSATFLGQSKAHSQSPTPMPTFMPIPMTSRPMTPSDDGRCETPALERASSPSASSISSPPTPPPPQSSSERRGSLRLGGSTSPSTRQRSVQNAISLLQAALDGKKGGAS